MPYVHPYLRCFGTRNRPLPERADWKLHKARCYSMSSFMTDAEVVSIGQTPSKRPTASETMDLFVCNHLLLSILRMLTRLMFQRKWIDTYKPLFTVTLSIAPGKCCSVNCSRYFLGQSQANPSYIKLYKSSRGIPCQACSNDLARRFPRP